LETVGDGLNAFIKSKNHWAAAKTPLPLLTVAAFVKDLLLRVFKQAADSKAASTNLPQPAKT